MNRFAGSDQRLYLKVDGATVQGFIKVGTKDLFYRDPSGRCKEISPLCVLDFYVHDTVQRQGLGKTLFMKMISSENVIPSKLAYDRPSPKLLKFLGKHFSLSQYVAQNNNFVIYDDYFRAPPQKSAKLVQDIKTSYQSSQFQEAFYQGRSKPDMRPSEDRKAAMNSTAPLNTIPGEDFNRFQSNAQNLLKFQGNYRDVYRNQVNPKYEKQIEELE